MALDPQIPLSATQQPSFAQNMGQVYQLAGAMEKQQDVQQERQDQQIIQEALKNGANFNTPDGIATAAESLKGKVSAKTSMMLSQAHQESKLNEVKMQEHLAKMPQELLEGAAAQNQSIIQQLDAGITQYQKDVKEVGQQEADRRYTEYKGKVIPQLAQQKMPNGQPLYSPQILDGYAKTSVKQDESGMMSMKYKQDQLDNESKRRLQASEVDKNEAIVKAYKEGKMGAGGGGGLSGVLERGGNVGMKNMAAAVAESQANHPWLTKEEVGIRSQQAKALSGSIADQTKKLGQLGGFERTAMANLDNLAEAVKKQREKNQVDLPAANAFLSAVKKVAGMPQNEAINLYGQEVAAELTKLASSANAAGAGGTLQDRQEWKTFFAPNSSFDQMMTSIGAARQSAKNRIESSQGQIADFEKQIEDLWRDPSEAPKETPKAAPKNTGKSTEVPRGAAPAGAIEKLKANPQLKEQFKAKYGYLPEGM